MVGYRGAHSNGDGNVMRDDILHAGGFGFLVPV